MINVNSFISEKILRRSESLFIEDLKLCHDSLFESIHNRSVLVIGGAGTIGSSYIQALLPFKPRKLVVVDISENGLTELTRDLRSTYGMFVPEDYITYPLNYADPIFEKMFRNEGGFDIVANFSAHKHVRSEKDQYSVQALLENNVLKARKLLDLLSEYPPLHFFCVSTDKAANPVNIMGCSKKAMEEMMMTYSQKFKITTARFANVAFSNGSLLAGFIERIMKKQPLTAPLDVRRYFVSPIESGQICLLASILGNTGEIFFPKLEESQMETFSNIADQFLSELGYKVKQCQSEEEAKKFASEMNELTKEYPAYYFNSDTTGEKDFEEFYIPGEQINLKRFVSLGVIENYPYRPMVEINQFFDQLQSLFAQEIFQKSDVVAILKQFIPNFQHEEKGKHLDMKM